MSLHVLRVPTRIASSVDVGRRWCFVCRKRVTFTQTVHVPTGPAQLLRASLDPQVRTRPLRRRLLHPAPTAKERTNERPRHRPADRRRDRSDLYWATCKSKPTTHLYRAHAAALQTVAQLTPAPVPVPPPVNPYQALTGLCAYAETDLALIAGLGIKHVRCDFSKATASWLTTCRKLGLKVTLIADYAMGLGTNGDHSQPKDYVAWSQKVAARVNGQEDVIEAVEVWNEPWLSSFWSPDTRPCCVPRARKSLRRRRVASRAEHAGPHQPRLQRQRSSGRLPGSPLAQAHP
jgi:hypothetical protein